LPEHKHTGQHEGRCHARQVGDDDGSGIAQPEVIENAAEKINQRGDTTG